MLKSSLKTIALSLITLSLLGIAYAWTEPTSTPPNGNTSIPLTTSSIGQIKTGALQVNGLWNNGTTLLDGNVGIGTTTPTAKLEIGGTAGVDGIKFPDGTVQTSASGPIGSSFVTGTYFGNGVDNREIAVGFQPDDVEVGTIDPTNYQTVHRNKNMKTGYSQFPDNRSWITNEIKSFTTNGFTIGTSKNTNEMSRTYWYKAFKGSVPLVQAPTPVNAGEDTYTKIDLGLGRSGAPAYSTIYGTYKGVGSSYYQCTVFDNEKFYTNTFWTGANICQNGCETVYVSTCIEKFL